MKQIQFDGRIGANGAEVRTTKGGKQYVRFSVANNSFANGAEKTEWYDVTSYDPYVIENRVKYLTKGTYVIISGVPNIEVNVKEGKIWLNQYVTATTIDTPSFKKKDEDGAQSTVTENTSMSTYTGGTQSQYSSTSIPKPQPAPATVSAGSMPSAGVMPTPPPPSYDDAPEDNDYMADDDLPF
jgi:single-stranded DNA-binding protein